MPERLNHRTGRVFLNEIEPILNSDRPQVIFDCSQVAQMDAAGVEMLLHCLHRVMRRDGDLKLASVPPQMAVLLEMTRTDRLFEIYGSCSDAVLSFNRYLPAAMLQVAASESGTARAQDHGPEARKAPAESAAA
jgi:anti-sigma B factor antagonist